MQSPFHWTGQQLPLESPLDAGSRINGHAPLCPVGTNSASSILPRGRGTAVHAQALGGRPVEGRLSLQGARAGRAGLIFAGGTKATHEG